MINSKNRIKVIYSQIDRIASKGVTNVIEYHRYVETLSSSGDYDNLLQCLYFFYEVNVDKVITIEDIRTKTWEQVLFLTENISTKKIKKLYDSKGIYQVGFDIFNDDNIKLGEIKEEDAYGDETKYYIKNREYARLTGTRKTFLTVTNSVNNVITVDNNDLRISEDKNLYNRYVIAINFLLE